MSSPALHNQPTPEQMPEEMRQARVWLSLESSPKPEVTIQVAQIPMTVTLVQEKNSKRILLVS